MSHTPNTYRDFIAKFPGLGQAHDAMTEAAGCSGPLDKKTQSLVRIGIAVGLGMESAIKSHVRRAKENGATEAEIEQAIALAMTTCGFPRTVQAWSLARAQFERDAADAGRGSASANSSTAGGPS